MLVAILHIIGTLLVLFIFFIATGIHATYRSEKRLRNILTVAAIRLSIPAPDIEEKKHASELAQYLINEYDSNKFRNRISDFFQPVFVLYEALTYLIQLGIVALSAWSAFALNYSNAKIAWIAVAAAILLWIGNLLLEALLQLATGRAPGEAKDGRRIAAKLNERNLTGEDYLG